MSEPRIQPVILSGGSGTRLWPMSRHAYPKQLLPLVGPETMIQTTARRVADPTRFDPPLIVCNDEHRFIIAEQMRQIGIEPAAIVLEPVGRNTAPAATVAALAGDDPRTALLILPSDHVIGDFDGFLTAIERAAAAAAEGALATFGIGPDRPETGYGYIKRGAALAGQNGVYAVERFIEKPPLADAERFLADGGYTWNSGMFVFRADRLLQEMSQWQPAVLEASRRAIDAAARDLGFLRLDKAAFAASPSISIDYAVMERTERAVVVPCDIGWSDVGSWHALWELGEADANGNVTGGDVALHDVRASYVRGDGKRLIAALGLDGIVIVDTADALLVAAKDKVQDVRAIVDALKAQEREEVVHNAQVYRPWGYYQSIDVGHRFQVKHISVKPGEKLSLQMHHHRAEHWIVVQGTAKVTRGDEIVLLQENESTFIPLGTKHRLENPGQIELKLIEIQSGAYLGEDDIVRFEDDYGRNEG